MSLNFKPNIRVGIKTLIVSRLKRRVAGRSMAEQKPWDGKNTVCSTRYWGSTLTRGQKQSLVGPYQGQDPLSLALLLTTDQNPSVFVTLLSNQEHGPMSWALTKGDTF